MPLPSSSLLQVKLRPPQPAGPFVTRPALMERLNRCRDVMLTVITAPAGAGKTRLVTEWLHATQQVAGWVSLDRDEAEPGRFVAYLIEAIRTVYPEAAVASQMMLNMPGPLSAADMAQTLLQDLEQLPGPLFLVLDDYHAAEAAETREVMQRLLRMPLPNLHLILTTRSDPNLPLAHLRSRYQLLEVRNADLRFSAPEAAHFLGALAGRPVDAEVAAVLHDYTEGWAVGLQLAGILLQNAQDQRDFAVRFTRQSHRWIAEYLVDEVVTNLPAAINSVVLRSALFDRFCASLLESALAPTIAPMRGSDVIAHLVNANLFTLPLDDGQVWYRYHHLFNDLLLQMLYRTVPWVEIREIHLRASAWYEAQGLIDDAIRHAQAAQDEERAVRLIETNLYRALNEEDVGQLDRWLNPLPEQMRTRPAILVAQAYRQQWHFQMDALPPLLARAEAGLAAGTVAYPAAEETAWRGAIISMRSFLAMQDGEAARSLELSESALELAPPTWRFVRGLAELSRALSLHQQGDAHLAVEFCRRSLAESSDTPDVRTLRLLLALCGVYHGGANADEIVSAAAAYLQVAERLNRSISIGWAHFASGWGHYQHNALDAAEADFRALVAIRRGIHMRALVDGYTGLALTLVAKGRPQEAHACARELRDFLVELDALSLLPVADSLAKHVRMLQGERIKISLASEPALQPRGRLWESPLLTAMRACIESGRAEHLEQAGACLEAHAEQVHKSRIPVYEIELHLLTARYHIARGATDAALDALGHAVARARPGGIVRMIVDEGPSLVPYLEMLVTRNVQRPHVQRILAAYTPWQADSPTSADAGHVLASELTFREMDVLALIAQQKTNDEIADQLVIALPTVKRHTTSIFKKLGVTNRRQATARALALGLVKPTQSRSP